MVPASNPIPASNNNIRFVLPGGLRRSGGQTRARSESDRSTRDKLERDIDTYIRAADLHLDELEEEQAAEAIAQGKQAEEVELVAKDPLHFWFAQVSV